VLESAHGRNAEQAPTHSAEKQAESKEPAQRGTHGWAGRWRRKQSIACDCVVWPKEKAGWAWESAPTIAAA